MSVVLEPVNASLYSNTNLEPQYITNRNPNTATIYLDSQDCVFELDKTDMTMSTVSHVGEKPSLLAIGVSRVSLLGFALNYITPNVNIRNNELTIYSSVSGNQHTVVLPEGYYNTADIMIDAIVTALNTLTGASGLTFNRTVVFTGGNVYNLNSVGGDYRFDLNCTAIKRGYQLYALPTDQALTNTKRVGSISLFYTRYVELCSPTLTQFAKLKCSSTGKRNDMLVRIPLIDHGPKFIAVKDPTHTSFSFLPTYPINTIEFTIRDQFGDLLYIPPGADGTAGGFFWSAYITIEI